MAFHTNTTMVATTSIGHRIVHAAPALVAIGETAMAVDGPGMGLGRAIRARVIPLTDAPFPK